MVDFSDFRAWVERQPAELRYEYVSPSGCALGQYLGTLWNEKIQVGPGHFRVSGVASGDIPREVERALTGPRGLREDWTFGALAERLAPLELS